MLSQSDTDISGVLEFLTEEGITAAFIVPTETGMQKSIMDATSSVRRLLKKCDVHDFERQQQGPENKALIRAFFVHYDKLEETKVSLYRPETKQGDPRVWIYSLAKYATARNLLAITISQGVLYIINCSREQILQSLRDRSSPGFKLTKRTPDLSYRALELLEKLRLVSKTGPIKSVISGDTGVGMTLEGALGIPPNANRIADYHGIELKAHRNKLGGQKNRSTLFSQVPNWNRSYVHSGRELLNEVGYIRDGVLRLYCTMSTLNRNPQGLKLYVDSEGGDLWSQTKKAGVTNKINVWELEVLRLRLLEKHQETFWVRADVHHRSDGEWFHYSAARHTRYPIVDNFETLLEAGKITLDYTVKQRGNGTIRDHGYLFKMHQKDLGALFPKPLVLNLT